jgi:hypothetical protein
LTKSFFASFFSKKEALSLLASLSRSPDTNFWTEFQTFVIRFLSFHPIIGGLDEVYVATALSDA